MTRFLLLLLIAAFAAPATAEPRLFDNENSTISIPSWDLSAPAVPPYAAIRVARESSVISMLPSSSQPANSFGWISSPLVSVAKPAEASRGNSFGLVVEFDGPASSTGTPPLLRVRLSTQDFRLYGEGGATSNQFLAHTGRQSVTALFNTDALDGTTSFRFYIDMVSVLPGQVVDPDFRIRISHTTMFTHALQPEGLGEIGAAWITKDGKVMVMHGSDRDTEELRGTARAIAFDRTAVAVIDGGNLYGYDTRDGLDEVTIQHDFTDDSEPDKLVVQAAVSKGGIAWLQASGEAYFHDMLTGDEEKIGEDYDAVSAGADGTILLMRNTSAGTRLDGWRPGDDDTFSIEDAETFSVEGQRKTGRYVTP